MCARSMLRCCFKVPQRARVVKQARLKPLKQVKGSNPTAKARGLYALNRNRLCS